MALLQIVHLRNPSSACQTWRTGNGTPCANFEMSAAVSGPLPSSAIRSSKSCRLCLSSPVSTSSRPRGLLYVVTTTDSRTVEPAASLTDVRLPSPFGPERGGLLSPKLQVIESAIQPGSAKQLLVAASLHYPAGIQYHDLIRISHGGQPVGNHQHCPVLHQPFDRFLDQPLRFSIQRAGCLIQYEDRW